MTDFCGFFREKQNLQTVLQQQHWECISGQAQDWARGDAKA
jgi:hypothetical protein